MEIGFWGMFGGVVTTFATAATAAFFTRRQSKVEIEKLQQEVATMAAQRDSEVQNAQVEIMQKYRELYNAMVEDLGRQLTDLKAENQLVRTEVNERRDITDNMRRELDTVHRELSQVRQELAQMKKDFPCAECPRRTRKTPQK
jgi:chromosome segregation ATPase